MSYGETELGVECALPGRLAPPRRPGRARRLIEWLAACLAQWG